jgi:hypothetical protein
MLRSIETPRRLNRDDTLVVFASEPTPSMTLLSRIVLARDPWLRIPPKTSLLATANPSATFQDQARELEAIVRDPRFWPKGTIWADLLVASQDSTAADRGSRMLNPGDFIPALANWADTFSGLTALTASPIMLRKPAPLSELDDDHPLRVALTNLADAQAGEFWDYATEEEPIAGETAANRRLWFRGQLDADIIRTTLLLGYERIVMSKYLSPVRDADLGSAVKGAMTLLERAARFAALVATAAFLIKLARLRPILNLYMSDDVQRELARTVPPETLKWVREKVELLLRQPTLPLLAPGLALGQPRRAASVWGESTTALGVPSWALEVNETVWRGDDSYAPMPAVAPMWGTPDDLHVRVFNTVKAVTLELADLELDGRYAASCSALGALAVPGPIAFPLYQQDLNPVYCDGTGISSPVDLFAMHLNAVYPVDAYAGARTGWIGEPGLTIVEPTSPPIRATFDIEPEVPIRSADWVDRRVDPRQIGSMPRDFLGDPDVEFVPHDPNHFADMFSMTLDELRSRIAADPSTWGELFDANLNPVKPTPWFQSTRTKRVWRNPIMMPEAETTPSIGIFRGRVMGVQRPIRRMFRDDEIPSAASSVDSLVDAALMAAKRTW